ncbi:cytochrome c-type biogenesis protein DsbD protein-disulfide reductase [Vibrio ponticus]|nr:cytochrome c-type biogenesis protein DsbD protein-disulfide reductase [Vibrio ponticus]
MALFGNNAATTSFATDNNRFVPVDEAFPFNHFQQGNRVFLDWQVKQDYYLYQERISVSAENVSLGDLTMRNGEPYHDEFFGDVHIYTEPLFVEVPLEQYQTGARLIVQYQGCAKAGFCYPPETRVIDVEPFASSTNEAVNNTVNTEPATQTATQTQSSAPQSQESSLAGKLADNWWTPLLFLALGVGLAFTPCVLPMYQFLPVLCWAVAN